MCSREILSRWLGSTRYHWEGAIGTSCVRLVHMLTLCLHWQVTTSLELLYKMWYSRKLIDVPRCLVLGSLVC